MCPAQGHGGSRREVRICNLLVGRDMFIVIVYNLIITYKVQWILTVINTQYIYLVMHRTNQEVIQLVGHFLYVYPRY